MKRAWTLQRRLMLAFASFSAFVAVLFGAYALLLTYVVEDAFFEALLRDEAAAQIEHRARTGAWRQPASEFMSVHERLGTMPVDLRTQYEQEPARAEFVGAQGRHYHVRRLTPEAGSSAYLVAEVSERLIVRGMRDEMLRYFLWAAITTMLLAALLGAWIARRAAAPIAALARHVEQMRPDDAALPLTQPAAIEEVRVLSEGLQLLLQRVRAAVDREREFTRDASHELRTPLATIYSACERLAADGSLSQQARQQVRFQRQSAWQLQQTVTTLLSLAREESAAAMPDSILVLPMIEQIVLEQSALLADKDISVHVDLPRDTRKTLPKSILHIILSNLIGNAFAHTTSGEVRIDVHEGRLRIQNTYRGSTASESASRETFVPSEASSGYGFGLSIVRRLGERYGVDLGFATTGGQASVSMSVDPAI